MITSSFFIENKEVIALWIIFSLLIFFAIEAISEYFENKKKAKLQKQQRRQALLKRMKEEKIENDRLRFHIQFINNVIDF